MDGQGRRKEEKTNMAVMWPSSLQVMPQPLQKLLQSGHTMLLLLATLHTKSTSAAYATAASTRHAPQNTRVLKRVIPSFSFCFSSKQHIDCFYSISQNEKVLCAPIDFIQPKKKKRERKKKKKTTDVTR